MSFLYYSIFKYPVVNIIVSIFVNLFLLLLIFILSISIISYFYNFGYSKFYKAKKDSTGSRILVVILHGYTHSPRNLKSLANYVSELLPNADIFVPHYSSWIFSNTDPFQLALSLKYKIAQRFEPKHHKKVILIGHSSGAVIIRKTYLYALGIKDDVRVPSVEKPEPWAKEVDRIVTTSGMNRGFNYSQKPSEMSRITYWFFRFGIFLGEITGSGKFIRNLLRGSPYIANLRVQWIRLAVDDRFELPPTIQIIGLRDDLVKLEDNYDLASDRNFRNITVPDAGHASIIKVNDRKHGSYLRSKFKDALQTPIEELDTQNPTSEDPSDVVVIVQHGIRETTALWRLKLKKVIEQKANQLSINTKVITPGYGYFPMGRFLVYRDRQKNVRMFMDDYTEALARNPKADIHFVGHSNGTYVLANALKNYKTFKVNRVVFAGSVVPRNFSWNEYANEGRVEKIRNDVATGDWVVGIFPRFLEIFGDNVGSAGHNGFIDNIAQENSYLGFFPGDHGAAIQEKYHPSIAHFILTGENIELELPGVRNNLVVLLSKLTIIVWLILFGAILGIGWLILGHLGLVWLVIYLAFLIVLLYFI